MCLHSGGRFEYPPGFFARAWNGSRQGRQRQKKFENLFPQVKLHVFDRMEWTESHQLRHAAQCSGLRFLRDGRRGDILELERELSLLGYDGTVGTMSAGSIVRCWKENGWIKISPNGSQLCLTDAGIEQLAKWEEEDALWERTPRSVRMGRARARGMVHATIPMTQESGCTWRAISI